MAHWISSKLKAAETLLQQIDQQAAESLRKNEKPLTKDQLGVESTPISLESKPLIKDQLKKKGSSEIVGNQSLSHIDKPNSNVNSRSRSEINQVDEASVSVDLNSKTNLSTGLTDSDWTELLSVPDKSGGSGAVTVNKRSNGASGIRGLKKDGKKVVNSGSRSNFPANRSLKSSRKSNATSENNASADSDERVSNVEDVTPRTSSDQSQSSGGVGIKRDNSSNLLDDVGNVKRTQELNGNLDGKKQHIPTDSRKKDYYPVSRAKKLKDEESNSDTGSSSSSDSEIEREREERRKRRQQILAERAAAKAVEAIQERENLVARLEGEKQSLEKILEERAKQQVQEASELQSSMMETMEAAELEKQKHNNTRMEALPRLAKLEGENANLAKSLANVQKSLRVEVDHVAELRQQIDLKETTQEGLQRKISSMHQNSDKLLPSKGVEFELEMLEAEYSFINDKLGLMQEKAKTLESSIETTRREMEYPTEVEIELKRRLSLLTDHLIQKQAQVETLSSEKATLLFRIEAVSRMLDENKSTTDSANISGPSSGVWEFSNSNLRPLFKERMQSGQRHFGSLVRQLDSLFCAGAVFLRRNSTARIWSIVYLVCLHVWVIYIMSSHSPVPDDVSSGAVISLENINNTGGI